jgi:hypothetical protein
MFREDGKKAESALGMGIIWPIQAVQNFGALAKCVCVTNIIVRDVFSAYAKQKKHKINMDHVWYNLLELCYKQLLDGNDLFEASVVLGCCALGGSLKLEL